LNNLHSPVGLCVSNSLVFERKKEWKEREKNRIKKAKVSWQRGRAV
jgi:hypothetical protein